MKIDEAFDVLKQFQTILNDDKTRMAFDVDIVKPERTPFKNYYHKEIPITGAAYKNGVYFITDMDNTILYIGKAGANNLQAEIWGKFGAPSKDIRFEKSPLAKWAPNDEYKELIMSGNFLVSAVIIEPREHASLAEVYLHVWCVKNEGKLPALNKRIG